MIATGLFLLCIIVFVFFILYFIDWINRSRIEKIEYAKIKGKEIFISSCRDLSIEEFLVKMSISSRDKKDVIKIIELLQKVFGLMSMIPAPDFLLRDAMVIEMKRTGSEGEEINECVEPFSGELVESLLHSFDKRRWEEAVSKNEWLPKSEDELVEYVANMTVGEFVRFCLPLMK